jgi:type VI secretion system (T6SS) baseplate-like injector VgrG
MPAVRSRTSRTRRARPLRSSAKYRGAVVENADPEARGRLKVRVPEVSVTAWALPCVPYAGSRSGLHILPPIDADVWVEFEAGDLRRPIWTGCLWPPDSGPPDENGAAAGPDVKIVRSDNGLLIALHDESRTITLSDANGTSLLEIRTLQGVLRLRAAGRIVLEAPAVDLAGGSHPGVLGDSLLAYLSQLAAVFNAHTHPGPSSTPPVPPMPLPAAGMLSLAVRLA